MAKNYKIAYSTAFLLGFLLLGSTGLRAQTTAALSGRVSDASSRELVGAKVTAVNEATNDKSRTVSGKDGTFSFPVLLPSTYTLIVEAPGFKTAEEHGITLFSGGRVTAPDTILAVGSVSETVNVETDEQILNTENGSLGATLDAKDIEQLALESRNADELLKTLPGVTLTPGTNNQPPSLEAIGAEPNFVGSAVSINGTAPHGGVSDLLDGADINDPGCDCSTIAIVNPDFTQEVSILSSSYGADVAHGPIIVNNISKSGSSKLHGAAYFFARNDVLNAIDYQTKSRGGSQGAAKYYYPGGDIGGVIPFTKKRLFFWFGYEKFIQNTGNATTLESYIPTADMLAGNFTATAANTALCPNGFSSTTKNTYCNDLTGTVLSDGSVIGVSPNRPAGMIPSSFLTTAAAKDAVILASIWPAANHVPTTQDDHNYIQVVPGVDDGYVYRARADYDFSDRTKAYVSYQYATDSSPASGGGAHIYWTPGNSIPFPGGGLQSISKSYVFAGHFLHTFSNTLTNEALGTLGNAHNATVVPSTAALSRSRTEYSGGTIFNTGDDIFPSYGSAGDHTYPDHSQQDIFTNGAYNLRKPQPSLADNLIKVWGPHTVKAGVFYEMVDNNQGGFNTPNGSVGFGTGGNVNKNAVTGMPEGSPSNPTANFILGNATGYGESSSNPTQDLAFKVFAFYLDDAWKATKRINVEYGLRFDRIGRWYDRGNAGIPVFLADRVANDFAAGIVNPGLQYHGINSALPKSGINSSGLLLSPRLGVSYDVFGTGKTLVRGGIGVYRFGDNWGDYSGGLSIAQGVQGYNLPSNTSVFLDQIGTTSSPLLTPKGAGSGTIQNAVDPNDHGNPTTYSYNLTITQRIPFKSLLEVSYVGNQSHNVLIGGGSGATLGSGTPLINVNKTPIGAFFKPDPVTGVTAPNPENVTENLDGTPTGNKASDYRPYGYAYGTNNIYVMSHTGYSNYNAFQITLVKRSAHLNYNLNYTHSKSLGTDLNEDPFTLRGNYGVEATDRPNVFNASVEYNDGRLYSGGNHFIAAGVNNWLISNITTYQGGGNLQAINGNPNPNFGYSDQYTGALPVGVGAGISGATYFGTDAGYSIMPTLTCNPKSGLHANQYVNPTCFAVPMIGTNGPRNYPYLSGPAYFDSDLAISKGFHVTERQIITFRASAFDWLNHPINAYTGDYLQLHFSTDYQSKSSSLLVDGPGVSNATEPNFGTTITKAGGDQRRIIELSVKYAF